MPTPVDYSSQEQQRDVYTLDQGDPLFRQKAFDKPSLKAAPAPQPKPAPAPAPAPQQAPARKPAPVEPHFSFYEAGSESYLKARRVAEMKFNTIKLLAAYVLASGGLFAVDFLLYPETWWCYWPIGAWGFILAFPVIKCFVFRGRDIRSVIESRIHRMALREVERFEDL